MMIPLSSLKVSKLSLILHFLHIIKYCLITSLFEDASELLNYNKSEERKMEEMMEGIAATGVKAGKTAIYLLFYYSIYLSHPFVGTLCLCLNATLLYDRRI